MKSKLTPEERAQLKRKGHANMLSISTDEAVQMLEAGWTACYCEALDCIEWRSPDGISGCHYHSESLNSPPPQATEYARQRGDIKDRPRTQ